jgi:hypothetical protein
MKIRMSKSYRVYEVYDTIEINKEDYPELESMSDDEALEYLKENLHEFEVSGGYEGSLSNEFEFGRDIIKDDNFDEEYNLYLVGNE